MKIELNKQITQSQTSLIREFDELAHELHAKYYLTLGEPDFPTPNKIKEACIDSLSQNMTYYGPTPGLLSTREAVCNFEKRVNGITYIPDQVIMTCGCTEAITTSLLTMLNEDDEVIIPIPAFSLYRQVVEICKAKVVTLDTTTNNFQISKAMLESVITSKTKAIIITSPNNPTGVILNDESYQAIHDSVINKEIYLISDDVYNQIVFTKRKVGLQRFDDLKDQLIICQSFSKPYAMPGWRCGYLIANKDFIKQANKAHQFMITGLNTFLQPALEVALKYDPKEMIESYHKRRDYVYNRLVTMGLEVSKPEGAFYIFPSIKKFKLDSWSFCEQLLREYKVALIPGICFETEGYVRISFCVDMETIISAMDVLEQFISNISIN